MKHSVSDLVVTQFSRSLTAFKGVLKKASNHAQERKFDENLYLQMRVSPDMFAFSRQIQIATDIAKGCVARLTGKTPPAFPDEETTLEQLQARLDRTIEYLSSFKEEDFKDYSTPKISFPWNPGVHLTGDDYLVAFAIPNFYFHLTTAYALLRGSGVPLGKGDFLGELNWKK